MVTAVIVTLIIGIPIDVVSLSLALVQTWLATEGEMLMAKCEDTVVRGAHGAASSILRKP